MNRNKERTDRVPEIVEKYACLLDDRCKSENVIYQEYISTME